MTHPYGNYAREVAQLMLRGRPAASAELTGSRDYPAISGKVWFYAITGGTLVVAEVYGLPIPQERCDRFFFGFHIHENGECNTHSVEPFSTTGGHFNPGRCEHPHHAGDLPPLPGNGDMAFMAVITDSFLVQEILGRSVVIHRDADDFVSQPAGNSGEKIACGVITPTPGTPMPR